MYIVEKKGRVLNGDETSQSGESNLKEDQRQILRCREYLFVLLTNIYCVPVCMSDTVLGPDDIMVKKDKVFALMSL